MAITFETVRADDSDYRVSLSKLIGKEVQDIVGYLSQEFGEVLFKLTKVVLADGSEMGVEGEHDFPYLVSYGKDSQPNFDDETLEALREEVDSRYE